MARFSKGADVLVFLRPEHVVIEPSAQAADRTADAVIRNIEFFGDHVRLRFDIASGIELVAKTTALDLVARLNVNDTVRVGWLDAQAQAFSKV